MVSFYAGLRAKEIAALTLGNVFDETSAVREQFILSAEQSKGRHFSANTMCQLFLDIFKVVWLKDASSHSGHTTYITRLANNGVDGAVVAGKVRESNDTSFGFNAQTETYGDLFADGVLDPAKVVWTALEDAASIAGLMITTDAMIADKPEPKNARHDFPKF